LKRIFPQAIEHKRKRSHVQDDNDDDHDSVPAGDAGCVFCAREKRAFQQMKFRVENWAKETLENVELRNLSVSETPTSREGEVHNFTNMANGCRLVHTADIQQWKKTASVLTNTSKFDAADCDALKSELEFMAFPNTHRVVLEFERQPVERLLASLRSLICREHHLVIHSAVFQNSPDSTGMEQSDRRQLSRSITVLSDSEYREYIASLAELLRVLNDDDEGMAIGSIRSPVVIDRERRHPKYLQEVKQAVESYHPAIRLRDAETNNASPNEISFSLTSSDKVYLLSPKVCTCETCEKEFAPLLEPETYVDEHRHNVAGEASKRSASSSKGCAAADPILVESDIEEPLPDTFDLRVYEVTGSYVFDEVFEALRDIKAMPDAEPVMPVAESLFLRRSSRKRSTRFPVGPLLREDTVRIGLHHNMASLKLLLYEKCELPVSGSLILVVLLDDKTPPETVEIAFGWGRRNVCDIVEEVKTKMGFTGPFDAWTGLFLLYSKDSAGEGNDITGLQESLMDSLLEMSNIGGSSPVASGKDSGKAKRHRPAERGFRGTLLQSSSSAAVKESPQEQQQQANEVAKVEEQHIDACVSDEEKASPCVVVADDTPSKPSMVVMSDSSLSPSISDDEQDDDVKYAAPAHPAHHMIEEIVEPYVGSSSASASSSYNGDIEKRGPKQQQPAHPSPVSNGDSTRMDDDTSSTHSSSDQEIRMHELVRLLMDIVQTGDEAQCLRLIQWALAYNKPYATDDELVDTAYAKYLDEQF
jgi:hypothetical protein